MFKNFTKTRNWFKINGHEYSTNIRYFKEHQLGVNQEGLRVKYYSLLEEEKVFLEVDMGELPSHFVGADSATCISEIHRRLLNGDYGEGEYVN